jgi:hypothetical protein
MHTLQRSPLGRETATSEAWVSDFDKQTSASSGATARLASEWTGEFAQKQPLGATAFGATASSMWASEYLSEALPVLKEDKVLGRSGSDISSK